MGNLFGSLFDQINPFDKGRTFSTMGKEEAARRQSVDPLLGTGIYDQDPNEVRSYINGTAYNFAGDPIKGTPYDPRGLIPKKSSNTKVESPGQSEYIRALQAQLAAQPKLLQYDSLGAYNRAKSAASKAQNTLYDKKLNQFLEGINLEKQTAKGSFNRDITDIQRALSTYVEGADINRSRTVEDVATALEGINRQEGRFQRDEGQQFDVARNQLAEEVAASGLLESGIGQAEIGQQQKDRNIASADVAEDFELSRQEKQLYQSRTLDDIARGVRVETEGAEAKKERAQFDLDRTLDKINLEERVGRLTNSIDRTLAIIQDTQTRADQDFAEFIAQQIRGGARSQDIALTQSIYG